MKDKNWPIIIKNIKLNDISKFEAHKKFSCKKIYII